MKEKVKKLIMLVILAILLCTGYQMYQELQIKDYGAEKDYKSELKQYENSVIEKTKVVQEEQLKYLNLIPEEYKGYKVSAKLEIEKLNISTYVLEEYSKQSMEVAVAKYFGPKPNEKGNYCIAGHNYIRKNMFSELNKLKVDDEFTLTDNWHGKKTYVIYDKYKATPTQTQALFQDTNGQAEVTLITCSDYSKKRIIIKARAI